MILTLRLGATHSLFLELLLSPLLLRFTESLSSRFLFLALTTSESESSVRLFFSFLLLSDVSPLDGELILWILLWALLVDGKESLGRGYEEVIWCVLDHILDTSRPGQDIVTPEMFLSKKK